MRRLLRIEFFVLFCIANAAHFSFAQTAAPVQIAADLAKAVDSAVQAEMARQQAVGVAIGIIRDGRVAYIQGYGFEDRENNIPVTSRTLFRWASVSKPLTAIAAVQLAERGCLDLDADVRRYVPEFPDQGVTITCRQLLCHQGGIVHYKNGRVIRTEREYACPNPFENVVLALDTFKESPLIAEPRKKFSYTTHGYILLSAVVQRAGRQTFADQVWCRIACPLGMTTLQPDYQWCEIPHRATGYRKILGTIVRSTDTDVSWKLGGGGFISNIEDMALFASGLINGKLISEESQAMMWTRQATSDGQTTKIGLGFFIEQQDGTLKVSHNGSQEKTRTRLVIYPHRKHGMVLMTNSEYADPGKFTTAVYKAISRMSDSDAAKEQVKP